MIKPATTSTTTKPLPYTLLKDAGPAPRTLELSTAGSRYIYPLSTVQRLRFDEAEGEIVITFIAEIVVIRGTMLEELFAELGAWRVASIQEQGEREEALANGTAAVRSITVSRRKPTDD